jgi:hypothetical protein
MLLQKSLLLQAYELLQVALLFRPTSLSEIHNVALSLLLQPPLKLYESLLLQAPCAGVPAIAGLQAVAGGPAAAGLADFAVFLMWLFSMLLQAYLLL